MNINSFIIAAFLAANCVGVYAAEIDSPASAQVSSSAGKTRAEVKAETLRALAAGEVSLGDRAYPKATTAAGTGLTRAHVKGDLLHAIAAHELHFSDTAYPDSGIATMPRTKVRARAAAPATAMAPAVT
jgi:hypothetical protein